MNQELSRSILRKIRYETKQDGDFVSVKAFLPPGFTMREFTFMFNLKDVRETENYDQYIRDLMFTKLVERIENGIKDRGLRLPKETG